MGGGKGDVVKHVAVVKPGKVMFEVAGASIEAVKDAFTKAGAKLPIKTRIVEK
jgi:large subunit ribosomal protein L16